MVPNGLDLALGISIHTPRMGSDPFLVPDYLECGLFQSTLPVWGVTKARGPSAYQQPISIHTPRMGSDSRSCGPLGLLENFNPHSPYGE